MGAVGELTGHTSRHLDGAAARCLNRDPYSEEEAGEKWVDLLGCWLKPIKNSPSQDLGP